MTTGLYRNRIAWPSCGGHSRKAGMACLNHWIPAFAGMTAGVDSSLCQAATGFLGGAFQAPLYHGSAELAERPASMQACP